MVDMFNFEQTSKLKCSTTGVNPALPDGVQTTKKEVLLSRSHSDSYRRIKRVPDDTLRQAASTDELAVSRSLRNDIYIFCHQDVT